MSKTVKALLDHFETKTRDDGQEFYCLRDDRPQWMQDIVREAHDCMLPDDFRYEIIHDCLTALDSDFDDPEIEPEHRNYVLCQWLASHGYRPDYCDDAARESFADRASIMERIQAGYFFEQLQVLSILKPLIEDRDNQEELS